MEIVTLKELYREYKYKIKENPIKDFIDWHGDLLMTELAPDVILKYLERSKKEHLKYDVEELVQQMNVQLYLDIRKFLVWLVEHGYIEQRLIDAIENSNPDLLRILSPEEVTKLQKRINHLPDSPVKMALELCLEEGIPFDQLKGIRGNDIEVEVITNYYYHDPSDRRRKLPEDLGRRLVSYIEQEQPIKAGFCKIFENNADLEDDNFASFVADLADFPEGTTKKILERFFYSIYANQKEPFPDLFHLPNVMKADEFTAFIDRFTFTSDAERVD